MGSGGGFPDRPASEAVDATVLSPYPKSFFKTYTALMCRPSAIDDPQHRRCRGASHRFDIELGLDPQPMISPAP